MKKVNFSDTYRSLVGLSCGQLGMEAEQAGETMEVEYVFYGKITDFSVLEQATTREEHEQWGVRIPRTGKNASEAKIRVRKTTSSDGDVSYMQTIKIRQEVAHVLGHQLPVSDRSIGVECNADSFEAFSLMSDDGLIKTRYMVPASNGLMWEIDVFKDPQGHNFEFVKIDLELPKGVRVLEELPPFPAGIDILVYNQPDEQTEKEKTLIKELYEKYFVAKNKHLQDAKSTA
jgi:CYTH domain-containing protein